ncbi:long-chain-fatty-acid--CoA ligase [Algicella marina]|uniref:3-methylmercaptopropionyl-CoA ligase n=1 Tax=Algicella marina TaxID=2683284 RepID=A0A6P1T167_9RHOB|nr:long-chain-fatty-acid--CoA ligase [Algicella marina]QHQ35560.1 long-chain-fatty-acid--CoA ligase [Algicella marina]
MHNLMQNWPLRVSRIIDHAARYHGNRRITTRTTEGPISHSNYTEIRANALRVAEGLNRLGMGRGDVVGVMAWNTARHMEVWYGTPGCGAALHTLNPRLFPDQLVYIINHAEDRILFVDHDLIKVIEGIWPRLEKVQHVIVMTDAAHMPETTIPDVICYEDWINSQSGDFAWVDGDETDACGICYTSGTTGNPKGVVYTHRSNTLHAMCAQSPDMLGLSSRETIMPVVPMFHANSWSIAYTAPLAGAQMVMPGRDMSPAALYEMLGFGVKVTAAVPTIWLMLLQYLEANQQLELPDLDRVIIGGSSCPRYVIETFQNRYGVQVLHAWGMTEMSPLGTVCSFKPEIMELPEEDRVDIQETTGHPPFTVDLKITDDAGQSLPWDSRTQGSLWARGDAVVGEYLKANQPAVDAEGWFDTGDVATMTSLGYMAITDRSKDVIKSGGEWISSIELENAALGHPGVAEAAAIGVPHPKWDERPILVVVRKSGAQPDPGDILATIAKRCAKWQVPDDVVFLDEIPHTATGKISKLQLRGILKEMNYTLSANA